MRLDQIPICSCMNDLFVFLYFEPGGANQMFKFLPSDWPAGFESRLSLVETLTRVSSCFPIGGQFNKHFLTCSLKLFSQNVGAKYLSYSIKQCQKYYSQPEVFS